MTAASRPVPLCWDLTGPGELADVVTHVARALGRARPAWRHVPVPWRRAELPATARERDHELARLAWLLATSPPDTPVRVVLADHGSGHRTLLVAERPDAVASGWAETLLGLPRSPVAAGYPGTASGPVWQRERPRPPAGPASVAVPLEPELFERFPGGRADVVAAAAAALVARYGRQREVLVAFARGAGFGGPVVARPALRTVRLTVAGDRPFADLLGRLAGARAAEGAAAITVATPEARPRETRLGALTAVPRPVPRLDGGPGLWLDVAADRVTCWYDPGPCDPRRVARFARHLGALLRDAANRRRQPLARLRVLDRDERAGLLSAAGPVVPGDGATVADRVLRWARSRPGAVAVATDPAPVTYHELTRRAAALAARLRTAGVGPDVPVGLWLPRSADLVAAALAVLFAGGVQVAFDAAEPPSRVRALLTGAGAGVLISRLPGRTFGEGMRVAVVDPDTAVPASATRTAVAASGLCCITYTAKSDGVLMSHEGVANVVSWCGTTLGIGPGDRVAQLASPGDGEWWLEAWSCLGNGAALRIGPDGLAGDELAGWLARNRVTAAFAPGELLRARWPADPALRVLVARGRLDPEVPEGLPFRVFHGYGSPETGMLATCGEVTPGPREGGVPIGTPLPNVRAYVLDEGGEPVPPGAVGELYVGGAGLARGYLGRPGARRSPFSDDVVAGGRRYATGDLVRGLDDGTLEVLGRADDRIKLRGFHIEPGEVEAALRRSVVVSDAAVVAHEDRLVAYVTASDRARPPDPQQLRRELGDLLPAFMVPDAVVPLDALPRTPHGRVNRRALAGLAPRASGEDKSLAC